MALELYSAEQQVELAIIAEQKQNIPLGICAGVACGIICAITWAAITVSTGWQIGYLAWAIGGAIGLAMWVSGRGMESTYGTYAAIIALCAIVLGNLLVLPIYVAHTNDVGYLQAIDVLSFEDVKEYLIGGFNIIDLVFYSIAALAAYRLSYKELETQVQKGLVGLKDEPQGELAQEGARSI